MPYGFTDALEVTPLDDGVNWRLDDEYDYNTEPCGPAGLASRTITIPKGFTTDMASIPRALWSVVGGPADGKYRDPAVLHDWLYRNKGAIWSVTPPLTRRACDGLLLEAMRLCGTPMWQRCAIWLGVRLGGWAAWRNEPGASNV